MRIINVSSLHPGLIVGAALYDATGQVMLQRGVALTQEYIDSLHNKGYQFLYIRDPDDDQNIPHESNLREKTRARGIQVLSRAFNNIKDQLESLRASTLSDMKDVLASDRVAPLVGNRGPLANLPEVVDAVLADVLSKNTLAGLATMRSSDTRLYDHSLEVCAISIMIGRVIGLNGPKLKQLATGALLHDIGKLFCEQTLSESRFNKLHTEMGYELLKRSEERDILVPFAAYEHHEHQDGTGQPRGLRGNNTIERNPNQPPPIPTLIGQVVAIANRYDNLLTGVLGVPRLAPEKAVEMLGNEAGTKLNREILQAFLKIVPPFPLGNAIVVTQGAHKGFRGWVSYVDPGNLPRPIITLVKDSFGRRIEACEIDLSADAETQIASSDA